MSILMVSGKLSFTTFLYISLISAISPPYIDCRGNSKHPSAASRRGPFRSDVALLSLHVPVPCLPPHLNTYAYRSLSPLTLPCHVSPIPIYFLTALSLQPIMSTITSLPHLFNAIIAFVIVVTSRPYVAMSS